MTSKKHSQVKLYSISLKICAQGVKETEDKVGIRDILDWYFEDLVKTNEDYELVQGDMMNDIRARYIQDEREDARKEGKIELEEKIITNILNEINDVDYIHKITKIPRSKIVI